MVANSLTATWKGFITVKRTSGICTWEVWDRENSSQVWRICLTDLGA
jgi:hypothetical protein